MKLDWSNDDWQLFLDFLSLPHYELRKVSSFFIKVKTLWNFRFFLRKSHHRIKTASCVWSYVLFWLQFFLIWLIRLLVGRKVNKLFLLIWQDVAVFDTFLLFLLLFYSMILSIFISKTILPSIVSISVNTLPNDYEKISKSSTFKVWNTIDRMVFIVILFWTMYVNICFVCLSPCDKYQVIFPI